MLYILNKTVCLQVNMKFLFSKALDKVYGLAGLKKQLLWSYDCRTVELDTRESR